jgi:crossover junction endodeoxyribonuclease RuvC
MRILGIDPGSHATGYGVVERDGNRLSHVAHGTLRPRGATPELRLHQLHELVRDVVRHHEPDAAAVERVFVAHSPRSALVLVQARGAVLAALGGLALGVTEYAPAEIKQAVTGSGRADKRQVAVMVRRLLCLARIPESDHAADALAAAIGHAQAGALRALGVARRPRRRRAASGLLGLRVRRRP